MLSANATERSLQIAGVITILGLLVEALSLLGRGAVAFLVFVGVGGTLLAFGVAAYLLALVRTGARKIAPRANARSISEKYPGKFQ